MLADIHLERPKLDFLPILEVRITSRLTNSAVSFDAGRVTRLVQTVVATIDVQVKLGKYKTV